MSATCSDPRMEALLTKYELGLLDPAACREVEVHLLNCDACFARLVQDSEVLARLLRELGEAQEDPSEDLRPGGSGDR